MIWSEYRIREEMKRLDRITGLEGATLPISFGNARNTLGFFSLVNNKSGRFRFSRVYFEDPSWPQENALDVIRHEYAHYMDFELNGTVGHGITWKMCCIKVGAMPRRIYNDQGDRYRKEKLRQEKLEMKKKFSGASEFTVGTEVKHPSFGKGKLMKILEKENRKLAEFSFEGANIRILDLNWVAQNCKRC